MYFHNWCWSEDFREAIFIYEMTYKLTFVLMFLENISWQKFLPNISVSFQTFLFLRNFPGTTIKYLFAILYITGLSKHFCLLWWRCGWPSCSLKMSTLSNLIEGRVSLSLVWKRSVTDNQPMLTLSRSNGEQKKWRFPCFSSACTHKTWKYSLVV